MSGSEAEFKEEHGVRPTGPFAGIDSHDMSTPESTPTEMEFTKVKFRRGLMGMEGETACSLYKYKANNLFTRMVCKSSAPLSVVFSLWQLLRQVVFYSAWVS